MTSRFFLLIAVICLIRIITELPFMMLKHSLSGKWEHMIQVRSKETGNVR